MFAVSRTAVVHPFAGRPWLFGQCHHLAVSRALVGGAENLATAPKRVHRPLAFRTAGIAITVFHLDDQRGGMHL